MNEDLIERIATSAGEMPAQPADTTTIVARYNTADGTVAAVQLLDPACRAPHGWVQSLVDAVNRMRDLGAAEPQTDHEEITVLTGEGGHRLLIRGTTVALAILWGAGLGEITHAAIGLTDPYSRAAIMTLLIAGSLISLWTGRRLINDQHRGAPDQSGPEELMNAISMHQKERPYREERPLNWQSPNARAMVVPRAWNETPPAA